MARMPSPSHYDRLASAIESVKASDPHWRNPERAVRSTLLILLLSPGGVRPSTMSGATVLAALERVGLASEDKKSYRYTKTTAAQKFGIAKDFTQKEREEAAEELGDSPGHTAGETMVITNNVGRKFMVRVVHKGGHYGLEGRLVHKDADPLIEFYDLTYAKFGPDGQFVSRYNASVLATVRGGLNLQGDVPVWSIDGPALAPVVAMAKRIQVSAGRAAGKAETTKKGAHGTLHLYVIRYYDTSERGNEWTTRKWAYNEEHAREKFYDGDSDGWEIESVKRA